jgi:hypothetical protein
VEDPRRRLILFPRAAIGQFDLLGPACLRREHKDLFLRAARADLRRALGVLFSEPQRIALMLNNRPGKSCAQLGRQRSWTAFPFSLSVNTIVFASA